MNLYTKKRGFFGLKYLRRYFNLKSMLRGKWLVAVDSALSLEEWNGVGKRNTHAYARAYRRLVGVHLLRYMSALCLAEFHADVCAIRIWWRDDSSLWLITMTRHYDVCAILIERIPIIKTHKGNGLLSPPQINHCHQQAIVPGSLPVVPATWVCTVKLGARPWYRPEDV